MCARARARAGVCVNDWVCACQSAKGREGGMAEGGRKGEGERDVHSLSMCSNCCLLLSLYSSVSISCY